MSPGFQKEVRSASQCAVRKRTASQCAVVLSCGMPGRLGMKFIVELGFLTISTFSRRKPRDASLLKSDFTKFFLIFSPLWTNVFIVE